MKPYLFYSIATFGVIISGVFLALKEPLINVALRFGLVVRNNTFFYNKWIDIADDIEVWIWNITNADEYKIETDNRGRRKYTFPVPKVEQVGPFVYRQLYLKKNASFLDDDGSEVDKHPTLVRIRQTFDYYSEYPNRGLDPETTIVNIPNLVALALPRMIEYFCEGYNPNFDGCSLILEQFFRRILNKELLASESMPVVKNVKAGDAIWQYNDPMIQHLKSLCREYPICAKTGLADILPDGIGMLEIKNTTIDWPFYEMDTGYKKLNETLQIRKFSLRGFENLKSYIDIWPKNSQCSVLKGTDGRSGQPGLDENTDVWVFLADLFKSFKFEFQEKIKEPRGFTSLRYKMIEKSLASPSNNSENTCFCDNSFFWQRSNMNCSETGGGYIIENAFWGFPLLLTNAHYLWGEKWLGDRENPRVIGNFEENREDEFGYGQFDTYVKYEKLSGLPIKGVGRYQFSLAINQDRNYDILKNMEQDTIIMPLLWANETFQLKDWGDLEDLLWWFAVFAYTGYTILFAVLLALSIGCIGCYYWMNRSGKDEIAESNIENPHK